MMRLQGKQKIKKIKNLINDLKLNPRMAPFISYNSFYDLGYIDFRYVKGQRKSFNEVEKNIKQNKYQFLKDFIRDLKEVFLTISDYILLEDILQQECKYFLHEIDQFQKNFNNQFREAQAQTNRQKKQFKKDKIKIKAIEKAEKQKEKIQPSPIQNRNSTFSQKLEMIYFLKAHQDNQHLIRQIGKHYNIGREANDQYIIKLDNVSSSTWLEIIQRKQA